MNLFIPSRCKALVNVELNVSLSMKVSNQYGSNYAVMQLTWCFTPSQTLRLTQGDYAVNVNSKMLAQVQKH